MSDNSTTAYSAPEIYEHPWKPPVYSPHETISWCHEKIPPRPFQFNAAEYWSWWKGYLAGNNCTADQMLRAIEEDREE